MKLKTLHVILFAYPMIVLAVIGCATKTDPATGMTTVDFAQAPQNVDLAVDLVQAYAAVFASPKDYAKILDYSERLRREADLPALKLLLAQIKGGSPVVVPVPATQPVK
jgi:hypothetical protein